MNFIVAIKYDSNKKGYVEKKKKKVIAALNLKKCTRHIFFLRKWQYCDKNVKFLKCYMQGLRTPA